MERRRDKKYTPEGAAFVVKRIKQLKCGEDMGDRIFVYTWDRIPIELWVWQRLGGAPTRIELYGLEHFPKREELEPVLAVYMDMREQHRRESGELAGPGRPRGSSERTKERLKKLAEDYWDTVDEYRLMGERQPTQKEFADSRGVSVSKLSRALKLHRDKS